MSRRFHSGVSDQTKAALHRKLDAWRLARGGYAIECKLKAVAMEIYDCLTLDELAQRLRVDERMVYTHGLEVLWHHIPRLWTRFRGSNCYQHFRVVNAWRPSWRYNPRPMSEQETTRFLEAVEGVYQWLENNRG